MLPSRILIIEDTPENMDLMCLILENAGHEVYKAYDGIQGLDAAFQHQPDLILLDLSLPIKDGWTVAEELKADMITKNIPIVAISAYTLPKSISRAYAVGCDSFLPKPFSVQEFNHEIDRFAHASRFVL